MTTINKYFDKVFLINLKIRPEKLKISTKLLDSYNIEFELYEAIDCTKGIPEDIPRPRAGYLTNKPGAYGCLLSHLNVIRIAKERGYKNILILEDDIDLSKDFIKLFDEKVKDLPKDWMLFYLGGSGHTAPNSIHLTKITEHISKTVKTMTTSSYAVNSSAFDIILNFHEKGMVMPIDQYYGHFQRKYPSYVTRPNIAWQKPGISDIRFGCGSNYTGFMKEID
jgi:glycosyl transferase family 25